MNAHHPLLPPRDHNQWVLSPRSSLLGGPSASPRLTLTRTPGTAYHTHTYGTAPAQPHRSLRTHAFPHKHAPHTHRPGVSRSMAQETGRLLSRALPTGLPAQLTASSTRCTLLDPRGLHPGPHAVAHCWVTMRTVTHSQERAGQPLAAVPVLRDNAGGSQKDQVGLAPPMAPRKTVRGDTVGTTGCCGGHRDSGHDYACPPLAGGPTLRGCPIRCPYLWATLLTLSCSQLPVLFPSRTSWGCGGDWPGGHSVSQTHHGLPPHSRRPRDPALPCVPDTVTLVSTLGRSTSRSKARRIIISRGAWAWTQGAGTRGQLWGPRVTTLGCLCVHPRATGGRVVFLGRRAPPGASPGLASWYMPDRPCQPDPGSGPNPTTPSPAP